MEFKNISRKVIVESTPELAVTFAANLVNTIICESVAETSKCCIALSGGVTPHALYQHFAQHVISEEVPWSQVQVFFGDERDVPQDHAESNYRMAQRTLLDHVPIPPVSVHPMRGDAPDLSAAATEYERTVRQIVSDGGSGGVPRFDLILLGMGAEGHVASLFPGCDAVEETQKLVTATYVSVLSRNRLTFTYPLINAARNIVMLVTGEEKAEAVSLLLSDSGERDRLPAAKVSPAQGQLILVLDTAAAKYTNFRA
jgi:6-phosphogluconolactonase